MRVFLYSPWATSLCTAANHLSAGAPEFVPDAAAMLREPGLVNMARLDRAWYAENVRCIHASFGENGGGEVDVFGLPGLADLLTETTRRSDQREWWALFSGHQPQTLGAMAPQMLALLKQQRVRVAYYAFDEASRTMPGFAAVAPYLDVLIHDEDPLEEKVRAALRPECVRIHRSWVANVVPFAIPFNDSPEEKIVFLGSEVGLTAHRQRQIEFLRAKFKDRFCAIHDHSLPVAERHSLNRYKVSLCPEGRHFTTPAMAGTHTDRPFWSGCMGLVPVAEDSKSGGRLEELHEQGLIVRYPHGNLKALGDGCAQALAATVGERRRIYDHFNRHETIGTVVADAIARAAR